MATTLVIDTHQLIQNLKESGFTEDQATGITKALQSVDLSQLATKGDVQDMKDYIRDVELRLIKWIVTVVGVGVAILALLIKF